MKKLFTYLMVMATLLIGGGKAMAQSVTIDGVVYSVDGDHAYVSTNSGIGDTVVVLGKVTINEVEYPVTEIGYRAFYRTTQVLAYTLPDGITSIGTEAFYDNYALKTINLPSSIETIGHMAFGYNWDVQITELPANLKTLDTEAFRGCQSATFTKIPAGVTHIPNGAFRGCHSLTSLELPKGLTRIDDYAFEGCTALTTVNIPAEAVITHVGTSAFGNTQVTFPEENGIRYLGSVAYELTDRSLTEYVIKEGTTVIFPNLFADCTNMTSITIPNSVVSIGDYAFYGCTSLPIEGGIRYADCYAIEVVNKTLTEYTLKDNVRFLGNALFQDCSAMTSISLPDSLTSIGWNAFYGCSSLTSVDIPSRVTVINDYTFHNCSALVSMTLPEGVTSIGRAAFGNCSALTTITLSPSLTGIAFEAFYQCNNLQKIINYSNLPLTQGSSNYGGVAYYAQQIINVDTIIDGFWFDTDANGKHHLTYYEGTDSILTLPSDFQEGNYAIDANVFSGHNEIVSIQFPDGITSIGDNTFNGCSALTSLILPESVASIGAQAFYNCSSLTSVNVPEGVSVIEEYTFYNCSSLTSLHLPDSLKSIGNRAFYGCSSLASVNIPERVYAIWEYTFYNCASLYSLTIPASVVSIANQAFNGCTGLKELILADGGKALSLGYNESYSGQFTPCKLEKLYLGRNLSYNTDWYYGYSPFYNQTALKEVVVGDSVTAIGANAFYNCASLDSLTIPASVTSIGDYAFQGCTGLKELILADGGKTLSLGRNGNSENGGLFNPCKLKKLYLGRNLSYNTDWSSGYSPFYNQTALKEVVVGDSVTAVHANAFYNCSSLPSIHLHEGITSVGANAFYGCGILTYVYSDIESPAVLASSSLRNQAVIYVPEGTYVPYKELFPNNIIVDGAAKEVTVHVAIPGTLGEEVLNQIPYIRNVNSLKVSGTLNNDDISTITGSMVNLIHLDLSKLNATSVNGIGHANLCSIVFPDSCKYISGYDNRENLTSVTLPDAVEALGENCFNSCDQLAEVTMSANLKTIGSRAFYQCGKLKEITFRDSLESIGSYAFYECSGLKSVSFGDGYTNILDYAFQYCTSLSVLTIGEGVSSNRNAFSGCGNITEIHIPNIESWLNSSFNYNHLPSIPNYVSSNTNLYIDGELVTDVVIPSSITSIRPYAFSQMSGITSVTIPEGVTSLANNAFFNCSGLTEVTMSKGLKTISSEAFYGCNRLASVIIPDGVTTIYARAFAQCDSLRSITLPSTLSNCAAGAFSGSGLTEVTCPAFFPPVTGGDVIGANNCTLYVPEWTLNRYKLANNWNLFAAIEPISGIYPSTISVYTEEGLTIPAEGLAEDYKPNMEIVRYDASNVGRLTLRGEKAMPLSTFRMEQTRDAGTMTSLVNYGTLTADSVAIELSISANNWHYLTFPYDVKISDIATLGDWVIRRYDGASRARADFSSTWQNVPYDSILHAGEGYIWYSTNGNFTVPAIENDNRNLIFANDARYTQLKEHASATEANYGWNLIGNPYPCFYDTRFMEFSSPITVRSGNSYAAYSPVDDSYILSPLEAFFVQCSADNNVVGFTTEGRQTDNTVRTLTSAPSPTRSAAASRSVLNLYLENGSYADHTRLVVNESASMDYEIACDAAKFMSEDNSLPQLFTFVNNERMAINERPLADGKAALGVYIGKTGSYTLSLDTRATDTEVYLIDKYSGTETDLNSFSYDFTADAGTYNDRFEIVMKRIGETAITEEATAAVKVMGTTGAINILNATAPIYVYNAAGALVATQHGGDVTIEVAPGVYVVKVGDEIHKVSVIK